MAINKILFFPEVLHFHMPLNPLPKIYRNNFDSSRKNPKGYNRPSTRKLQVP